MQCKVQGHPSPKIEWHKDDERINQDIRIKMLREGEFCILSIKDTKAQDSGVYMCVAFNDFGSEATSTELVIEDILIEPKFEEKMKNIDICEGEDAIMKVKVKATPTPAIQWYKEGKEISNSGQFTLKSNEVEGIYSLLVRNCNTKDAGRYTCLARNEAGETKCTARLDIKPSLSAPVFDGGEQEVPIVVEEGRTLKLEVSVKGKPIPKLKWYKDGRLLLNTSHLSIGSTGAQSSLGISRVAQKDAGVYKCAASSTSGTSFKLFNVTIPGMKMTPLLS